MCGRRGSRAAILGVPQLALGGLDIDPGPEAPELIERGLQLQVAVVLVVEGPKRACQDGPRAGDLVRRADLAPAADPGAQLARRRRRVALGHEHPAQRDLSTRLERRRRVALDDRFQLVDRGPRPPDLTGRDRDLDLGRQEACPGPAIPGLLGHRPVDRGRCGLDLALGQADERERGLRRSTPSVRLAEGRLRPLEVAPQATDVADRVEPVGLGRDGVEGAELAGRPFELLLRSLPRPADRGHLGAVDPADARESPESDCRSQYRSVASIHSLARR